MRNEIKEFGICPKYLNFLIIIGAILSLTIVGLLPLVIGIYLKYAVKYKVTDKEITVTKGLFSKVITSIRYNKITDISLVENVFNKSAFQMGTLLINTAGGIGHEAILLNIKNPNEIKAFIEQRLE